MNPRKSYLLNDINSPVDLKKLSLEELEELAEEIRYTIINTVSDTGGHLGSNLGVVELTIALHYAFNTPNDKIVWDVSHQAYAHKLLTGRRDGFSTLRQRGGISGFTKRAESAYDAFDAGHGGTSISAALGMARAFSQNGSEDRVIAVIGDGSLTSGMALEALNDAGHNKDSNLLVIVNDNGMSISPNVGGLSNYMTDMRTRANYIRAKHSVKSWLEKFRFGHKVINAIVRFKRSLKRLLYLRDTNWFETLGFIYYGPTSGHDIKNLVQILNNVKNVKGPILLHVITEKGKGYSKAEEFPSKYHGVTPFDPETGYQHKSSTCRSYTEYFSDALCALSKEDDKIVAITAAMADGTGVNGLACMDKGKVYDVGMAEEHAVTLAAGLAAEGLKPVVAIYSTFCQRAYDQIIHDVALINLPVIFALDRAGVVGGDGPTHQGIFDLSYLSMIPNMSIMAPANGYELEQMLTLAVSLNKPVAIRYPKECADNALVSDSVPIEYARGVSLINEDEPNALLIAVGSMVTRAVLAADILKKRGVNVNVFNARFVKPLDEENIIKLAKSAPQIYTLEENVLKGGFGQEIMALLAKNGVKEVTNIGITDHFPDQGTREEILEDLSLTAEKIAETIFSSTKLNRLV